MKRRICVLTGSRADYSLLYWVMREIADAPDLELQVVATCMHLSPEFGLTYKVIEADGFVIDAKVENLLSGDTPVAVAKATGLATIGLADAFANLRPDLLLVLGDRFELLAGVQAALFMKIPVAHIAGGDTTEGAYDEAIRHAITKMSHLHFVTNAEARQRVLQLGENPQHVHDFGSPGVDYIRKVNLLPRAQLESRLGFQFRARNLLVTFHPVTLESRSSAEQMTELLAALSGLDQQVGIIFTKPNADNDGRIISSMIDDFVAASAGRACAHTSLGPLLYLSVMAQADVMVGNSSSGLYEMPSFKKPTVNVGDRQRGRTRATSVIDCGTERQLIGTAIERAFALDCSATVNPYGDGHAAERIVAVLRQLSDPKSLLRKSFHGSASNA